MSAAENKQLLADAVAAWGRGQNGAFFKLLADDLRWTIIGTTVLSRTFTSKADFIEGAVKPLGAKLIGAIKPTLRDIIADGDRVVLQWDGHAEGINGVTYAQTYCWVMRLAEGKVREGTAYLDTELITRLWS